jgi:hypothetical protein
MVYAGQTLCRRLYIGAIGIAPLDEQPANHGRRASYAVGVALSGNLAVGLGIFLDHLFSFAKKKRKW